jgi:hypothetical protein
MLESKVIQFLRFEKKEHLLVYKNDKLIKHFVGDESSVVIPNVSLPILKDATVYHNHVQGSSFSESDIVESVNNNVKIIFLITKNFQYSLIRPDLGWGINFESEECANLYNNCKIFAREIIDSAISKNEIRYDEINLNFNHYIWVLFFNNYGISYKKEAF